MLIFVNIDDVSKAVSLGDKVIDESLKLREHVTSINQKEQISTSEDACHKKYKTIPRSMLFKLFRLCYLDLKVDMIDLDQ